MPFLYLTLLIFPGFTLFAWANDYPANVVGYSALCSGIAVLGAVVANMD